MRSYGQFCPISKAAEVFCERWTPLILRDLGKGVSRFSELQRGVARASPTLLSRRLRELETEGLVERRRSASGQPLAKTSCRSYMRSVSGAKGGRGAS
jgi:DNA-binding HxlR family transcriptional regulator